jgi:hypothetical protein
MMKYLWIVLGFFTACSSDGLEQKGFQQWSGQWRTTGTEEFFVETWKSVHENEMSGYGAMLISGDTVFSEKIQLIKEKEEIYYIVTSKDNNEYPIRFKLTNSTPGKWVFENPAHDFPTRITYILKKEDTLIATVEGSEKTAHQNFTLHFKRN